MNEEILLKIGAAYIRVSDERQDEYSPDSQLKKIRDFAAKDGVTIPDEYVFYDDGISGRNVKKRGDFNRMIAMAKEKSHPFETIYVWKFSRFARNQEQAILFKNLLRKHGVSVVSVSEPIPEGHFGTLLERVIEWMDEFYSINLSAEVMRGFEEKLSRGEPTCAPPFGYIIKEKMYYPDEENGKADVVREVFALFANGHKQREIAIMLGKRGVRTNAGKMPENRWIDYMLRNPCYIGMLRLSLNGEHAVSKRKYDSDKIVTVKGHHEPLISMDLWNKVQEMLEKQAEKYRKYARKENTVVPYMLKGLIRCSDCGGAISMCSTKSGKSKTDTMQCCNYSHGKCHVSHSVIMPKIEEAFVRGIESALGTLHFEIVPKKKKVEEKKPNYEKLIEIEEKKIARAKEAYLSEIDTLEQYAERKKDCENRIAALKDMQAKDGEAANDEIELEQFACRVRDVVDLIKDDTVSAQAKNEMLLEIVEKAVYDKANESLAIYFRA